LKSKIYASLANSLQLLGEDEQAEENLIKLLTVSEQEKHYKSLADATLNLGVIYLRQGKQEESKNYIKKHYNFTQNLDQRGLIDQSRVNVGVTIGEWSASEYIKNVNKYKLLEVVTEKIKEFV